MASLLGALRALNVEASAAVLWMDTRLDRIEVAWSGLLSLKATFGSVLFPGNDADATRVAEPSNDTVS